MKNLILALLLSMSFSILADSCINSQNRLIVSTTSFVKNKTNLSSFEMCFKNKHEADEAANEILAKRLLAVPTIKGKKIILNSTSYLVYSVLKVYTN